ncbi:DNA translocase FtsK [Bacillaceae bacterium S4-13-56]
MAKKRKNSRKKKQHKLKASVKNELIGLLFILIAVFGSGASAVSGGAIPALLTEGFQFLFGIWFFVASVFMLFVGIFFMIKQRKPNFGHKRLIGFYILFTSVLLITHIQVYEKIMTQTYEPSLLKATWNQFTAYTNGIVPPGDLGGGMLGAVLFTFTYYLFSSTGAKIVAFFGGIVGVLFLTEFSIGKAIESNWNSFKKVIVEQKNSLIANRTEKQKEKKQQVMANHEPKIEKVTTYDESFEEEPIIQDFTDIAYAMNTTEGYNKTPQGNKSLDGEKQDEKEEFDSIDLSNSTAVTEMENEDYILPPLEILEEPNFSSQQNERSHIQQTVKKLERTFQSFGVKAKVTKVHVGPAVTKYEVYPDMGVKVSKIVGLHDDLALALAAKDIRIEAPIPGKSAVGIEVPNQEVAMVSLREVLDQQTMQNTSKLAFVLGRDISGDAVVGELNKMPHLLVAGATGSGKSVCINGIITSILMRAKPHEVKMMMIDPKKVELNVYNGIPHLLSPVVTDPKKASRALKKVVSEMERRYDLFSETGTRNIEAYNNYIRRWNEEGEELQPTLPYIVVLVDELADLMMVASNDVEDAITRLAQMARAAGIHLIIATQRPSVDVITGVIKANIPSRIAFSVSSQTDSRTILDMGGAEKLLGRGDMLYMPVGISKPTRVQGAFLSDEEVERVVNHCIEQQKAQYQEDMIPEEESAVKEEVDDELYEDAVELILEMQTASVSMLQRRFRIGYTRAARLIDAMEQRGIVGPYEGSKPREVLLSKSVEEERTL